MLQAPVWLAVDQGRQTDLWAECGGFHAVAADSSVFVPPVTALHVPREDGQPGQTMVGAIRTL